ncbi:hypothetical protein [Acinetobacter shaoyimingii]|uniref:Uncharacterized protein n=1 Tax=Acinetobacter shaoyimingii TaxID=2715164 RepID=A0A6G8RZ86_9GAMM|nr:hypothetical protein [Acinetobacter shaoyimingii]QIO07108.1 hypothetical protein G8E00_14785 [Acinetobacter shaoyimingii]
MKKIFSLLVLIILVWLAKLSYDDYGLSKDLLSLQNDLRQSEQKNANLNDQLVAVQRQKKPENEQTSQVKPQSQSPQLSQTHLQPANMVKSQLELIQFAIQQRQFIFALDKINLLDQSLDHYNLAAAIQDSLHAALQQDKKNLQQFILAENNQIQQLQAVLTHIDQLLKSEQNNPNIQSPKNEKSGFWSQWIKVDRVDLNTPEIVHRRMILKEAELRVLLAKQNLEKGQVLEYQNMLDHAIGELKQLPDQNAKKIVKEVQKLKQIKMLPEAKLISFTILG